jgi:hypothetical protein
MFVVENSLDEGSEEVDRRLEEPIVAVNARSSKMTG